MALLLHPAALEHIVDHAGRAYPAECCGALVGELDGPDRRVKAAWPMTNVAGDAATNFAVDPADYTRAEQRADQSGVALVGFYHSHPRGAAAPSSSDLALAWPSLSYVIVAGTSGTESNMTSWRLRDDRSAFENEEIILWQPGS